ncbi:hypothetical protein C8J56DRAFT_1049383 [Mycena floridula]|nr:hypothetical protein C8J56DRAFT_1062831 [Mycena floridula]KAJ7588482.1 hypothetical protein C8J56DRAFT_1049383 [Mycena floridula]
MPPSTTPWLGWEKGSSHPMLHGTELGKEYHEKLVCRHFQASVSRRMESQKMLNLAKDKQRSSLYDPSQNMLFMEVIDVKECSWPEPSSKQCASTKFDADSAHRSSPSCDERLKVPLIVVRYAYTEGRPKDGLQFTLYLERLIQRTVPNASWKVVRKKLGFLIGCAEEVGDSHLLMFARLLFSNTDLLDAAYLADMQSHWNRIPLDVIKETRISYYGSGTLTSLFSNHH